jgi:LPXTG-motif cell wall-anchored protein
VALGIPDTPQPESTPVAPKTPEEGEVLGKKGTREERVLGKVGTREEATTPTTPVTFVQAGGTQDSETLAMTGFNVPILAILGGLALLGGSLLLRRSRAA